MKTRWLWLVMVVSLFVGGTAQTAWANHLGCFRSANICFIATSYSGTWWARFTGSLDCELDLISCIRSKLIGFG